MRFRLAAIGLIIFTFACPAWATTIDTIGTNTDLSGSITPTSPFHGKGNLFQVNQNVTLTQQEFYVSNADPKTATFCVYESTSDTQMGDYTRIQSNQVAIEGNGSTWYSSGPISVPLQAGKYYIAALVLPGSFTSFWKGGLDSFTVSFGQQLSGISTIADPAPTTLAISSDNKAIYYQRLTTVPEPTTAALLSVAAVAILARRRNHCA